MTLRILPALLVPHLVLTCLLLPTAAAAHDADIVFIQLSRGEGEEVLARVTLSPQSLALLAPVDADGDGRLTDEDLAQSAAALRAGVWEQMPLSSAEGPCARGGERANLRQTYVELWAEYRCAPGELTQTFRILEVLPANHQVVLGAYGDGGLRNQGFARGHDQTLTVLGAPGAEAGTAAMRGLTGWIALGVEHIFLGIDHLAFLLAVILVGGSWRRILLLVTTFTVAHSITLGLAALEVIRFGPGTARWVEVGIALSIVWVALENLVLRRHGHRALLTFLFGLVHGFGFASVLAEYGLGQQAVVGLFGFNLGVELGQAAVVAVAFPLIRILQRRPDVGRWTVRVGSAVILLAGVFWSVERVLAG